MSRYALIENGTVSTVVEQSGVPTIGGQWLPCDPSVGPGHRWTGSAFQAPLPVNYIATVALLKRITQAERIAIRARAASNQQARDFEEMLKAAKERVNLKDPLVGGGLHLFEQLGDLAAGRADAIVNAPVQPDERP